jgi:hypothetical protein
MTSIIFAVIMAACPAGEAQDSQIIASKTQAAAEEPLAEPKIQKTDKAVSEFYRLLKKGKLTLPGILLEEPSDKKD